MKMYLKLGLLIMLTFSIVSCSNTKGEKAVAGEAEEVKEVTGQGFAVNIEQSKVLWDAAKVTGKHNGTVMLKEGAVVFNDGELTGGSFMMDMNTIEALDLEGDSKANLEAHLKGTAEGKEDDFFNVGKYPTAKFEISKATKLLNNEEANYIINGNLTIRDITKSISFRANVNKEDNMVKVSTPPFKIDRTEWGIQFRSTKFFDDLKDKAIDDEFSLQIELVAG